MESARRDQLISTFIGAGKSSDEAAELADLVLGVINPAPASERRRPASSVEMIEGPLPDDARSLPGSNRYRAALERKRSMLEEPHIAPLTAYVMRLRASYPERPIPWFDPDDAGVDARILAVLESPGPRAGTFISADNDDKTAPRMFQLLADARIDRRSDYAAWNTVPWYLHGKKPSMTDLREAAAPLRELLGMFTQLRVVVLLGGVARDGWRLAKQDGPLVGADVTVLRAPHPSPRTQSSNPHALAETRAALTEAKRICG
jgi:hypothetical protein